MLVCTKVQTNKAYRQFIMDQNWGTWGIHFSHQWIHNHEGLQSKVSPALTTTTAQFRDRLPTRSFHGAGKPMDPGKPDEQSARLCSIAMSAVDENHV